MQSIYIVIATLFVYYISYLNISFLLNKNVKKIYLIIGIILFPFLYYIPSFFKIIFQYFIFIFLFYSTTKNFSKLFNAVTLNILSQCITETVISLILILLNIKPNGNYILLTTIVCSIFSYIIIRSKSFIKIWNYIKDELKVQTMLIIFFIGLCLMYICTSYKNDFLSSSILTIFVLILIFLLIRQISFNYGIEKEYNQLYKYLKNYEELLSQRVIDKHTYLNNLIVLKQMLPDQKMAKKYIDTLLKDEDNILYESVLKEVSKIDIQAVKGLLYYKLTNCIKCGIDCILNVDYKIRSYKISDDLNMNITKILSIMIDLAENECLKLDQKNLSIYIYEENKKIIFEVSNTIGETLNLNMLLRKNGEKNKINTYKIHQIYNEIKKNEKLDFKNEVHDDIFIQRLIANCNE
mgnify:FL=1